MKTASQWLAVVLHFDSLFLLFQIGWGDLAGFFMAAARRYRIGIRYGFVLPFPSSVWFRSW
jgi:hypothetical protein